LENGCHERQKQGVISSNAKRASKEIVPNKYEKLVWQKDHKKRIKK
jgi:hypothetical protein